MNRSAGGIVKLLLLSIAITAVLRGQEFRGSLLGRVSDASGALVPGASVKAVQMETNAVMESKTNDQGNYRIPFLLPGTYKIVVSHAGFKTTERDSIRVSVGSEVSVDMTLEVGSSAESVTVSADAPLVNTSNADLGVVIDNTYVRKVPVSLTRNAMNRIMLSAGVTGDTGTYTSNAQSNFSIMGGGGTSGPRRP